MFQPEGPTFLELTRQALSSTRGGYDLLAPKFDRTPFRTPDLVLTAVGKALAPATRALDVCCGTGAGLAMLRPLARERVVGIDFSLGMLAEAQRTQARDGVPVSLVQGDATAMPFEGAFDLATCFGALGHFVGEDQDRFLAAIARALVPGGRFAFVTSGPVSAFEPGYWIAKTFNAVMHVRNALVKPPFVMFYLTFLLPGVIAQLERHGFTAEVMDLDVPRELARLKLVVATKR